MIDLSVSNSRSRLLSRPYSTTVGLLMAICVVPDFEFTVITLPPAICCESGPRYVQPNRGAGLGLEQVALVTHFQRLATVDPHDGRRPLG